MNDLLTPTLFIWDSISIWFSRTSNRRRSDAEREKQAYEQIFREMMYIVAGCVLFATVVLNFAFWLNSGPTLKPESTVNSNSTSSNLKIGKYIHHCRTQNKPSSLFAHSRYWPRDFRFASLQWFYRIFELIEYKPSKREPELPHCIPWTIQNRHERR